MKTHDEFIGMVKKAVDGRLPSVTDQVRAGLLSDIVFLALDGVAAKNVSAAVTKPSSTTYVLSQKSIEELKPVHPKLRQCVELAIGYSLVDFRVNQGLRTIEEQRKAVAEGHSRTMKSKHLKQTDGWVWAVDLVVLKNGVVSWVFGDYGYVAAAMDKAATELGIAQHVRWGCVWDRVLADFGGKAETYLAEAAAYAKRHAGSDLLDAPHFEWIA